jgi:hypothetical protein
MREQVGLVVAGFCDGERLPAVADRSRHHTAVEGEDLDTTAGDLRTTRTGGDGTQHRVDAAVAVDVDLLEIIALEGRDDRIPGLLLIGILALIWHAVTQPEPESAEGGGVAVAPTPPVADWPQGPSSAAPPAGTGPLAQ